MVTSLLSSRAISAFRLLRRLPPQAAAMLLGAALYSVAQPDPACAADGHDHTAAAVAPQSEAAMRVHRAFERFEALAGDWLGQSTKGWTEKITYRTIAQGSVVMETSFDAHPNEMMVTMLHPDGDRLVLTHYCVAKNQPRLVMTGASADLSQITFEFLDGTNLPSRDRGHMDKVVFRFASPDSFSSQWTWYQDGKESWMEEIHYVRATASVRKS